MTGNTTDGFILKYDNTLTPLAFTAITNASATENARNVITDASGNIYVLGSTGTSTVLNSFLNRTGTTINLTPFTTISPTLALIKYDPNLQIIPNSITTITPVAGIVQPSSIIPFGIDIDTDNNVYIGFTFNGGSVSVNNAVSAPLGGPVTTSVFTKVTNITPVLVNTSYNNGVIVKYNSSLQGQWATTLNSGVNTYVSGTGVFYDPLAKSVYVTGAFQNYNGNLNIQNYKEISNSNLITDLYARMTPVAIGVSTGQISGFIVKYKA
jgi:hypothetical protein